MLVKWSVNYSTELKQISALNQSLYKVYIHFLGLAIRNDKYQLLSWYMNSSVNDYKISLIFDGTSLRIA